MKDSLQAMNLLGIKAQFDDAIVARMVELSKRLNQLAIKPRSRTKSPNSTPLISSANRRFPSS